MLEGLEIAEITKKTLSIDNEKYRLDSEFFLKKYTQSYLKIKSFKHTTIGCSLDVLTDFHANGSYKDIAQNFSLLDDENYGYMIRSMDLERNNFESDVKYIDKHAYNYLSKTKLYGGELLINKIGSPGRAYLMPHLDKKCSLGMNLFLLRFKGDSKITAQTTWLFFNTEIGKKIIERKINGTAPLTIDKAAIRSLYVPIFTKGFNEKLADIIKNHEVKNKESKVEYHNAENLLSKELCLDSLILKQDSINIKSMKSSFLRTGRLDAEYYQSKYDQIIAKIRNKCCAKLQDLVTIQKSVEPGSDAYQEVGIPFYRVSNLTKLGLTEPNIHLDEYEYSDIIRPKKDIILLTKDGTVGMAYKVTKDIEGITSGAVLHLKIKDEAKILPDYLTLVLNSMVVQLQAERDAGGSIIQHWKPSEIAEVVIPLLDIEVQQKIAELIQQSFNLKAESERLLEDAKKLIEYAIENGEDKALVNYELGLIE